ncbi:MAG: DUF4383 domain-containing protein [Actinomycetota bacterium]|nr:DUF4383 domain-containing protein [Actinomycetota bacterium]
MAHEFRGNTGAARTGSGPLGSRTGAPRSLAQTLALVFGATFLLVGVAGFIPGVTSNYDELTFLGTDSNAELLGLFRVSVVHNIVHLLFGIGILAAAREQSSLIYLIGGGLTYLVVTLYGFVIDETADANFLPINDADNLLHLVLGLAMIGAGLLALAASRRTPARA